MILRILPVNCATRHRSRGTDTLAKRSIIPILTSADVGQGTMMSSFPNYLLHRGSDTDEMTVLPDARARVATGNAPTEPTVI